MDISLKFDPEVLIGADTISLAGTICSRHGEHVMVAADKGVDSRTVNRLKDILKDSGVEAIVFDGISEDSPVNMAENVVELCCAGHCTAIIGFGGQKTQIIARMAAIMSPLKITAFELLDGRKCLGKFLPFISIPTTGIDTFAFTHYFIAADPRDRFVKAVDSPHKLCSAIIVDDNLFQSFSGASASISILGGFCTAVEAYCSTKANFLSDALLERALLFFGKMLKGGPGGINAETYTQAGFLASLGASVSSPGIGSALSFAINARYPAIKQLCSAVLFTAIAERLVSARPEKMARVASYLGSGKSASVAEAANSVAESFNRCMTSFNVQPNLKEFKIPLDKLIAAAEAIRNLELVSHSPWTVSEEDVFEMIKSII
jgi:alcohol dehydrogenase